MDMHDEYSTRKKPQDEEEAKKYEVLCYPNTLPDQLDEEVLKFRGVRLMIYLHGLLRFSKI